MRGHFRLRRDAVCYQQKKGTRMGWQIECNNDDCGQETWVRNIVELLNDHCDELGWFRCAYCNGFGYIHKSYAVQEGWEPWEPFLRGAIRLNDDPRDTYQPFVFLISGEPNQQPHEVWFSYYKDTRADGGRLKLGYGPGGPPVLGVGKIAELVDILRDRNLL